ncbi:MAG: VWA domain-containing protein [Polyangiaceae bacterium]|nr:VWA domain-containing protein [Polyangiaceae bacterium]
MATDNIQGTGAAGTTGVGGGNGSTGFTGTTTTAVSTTVGAGGGFTGTTTNTTTTETPVGVDAGADAMDDASMVNCEGLDQSKPVVLYLSPDDSNSMGSPVHARERLNVGKAPQSIRTYEFLNYYHIQYPAPLPGKLALFAESEPAQTMGEYNLQLAVRSFDATKPRRPITVTFVLDTSGSMAGPGMEREVAAVKAIAKSLASGDIVNVVTWNTDNQVLLSGHPVTGPNDVKLLQVANGLTASGGTDLHGGLVAGYQLAQAHYGEGRLNRLVLISDGGANVGVVDEDLIALHSEDADKEGIYLVGVGTGPEAPYNDMLMDVVTDKGRGAYVYLDTPAEADKMFVDRFDETMEVAARGVQIELTMPWYFSISKFSGEEFSTDPTEIEPQHLAPSDAVVLNQVLKACDPAVVNNADPIKLRVTWQTPITYENKETLMETTLGDLLAAAKPTLPKGHAIVAYAEALKSQNPQELKDALAKIQAANMAGTDPELNEIATLIAKHPAYTP